MTTHSDQPFQSDIEAVAICRTPYKQKFGIPRQPGLVNVKGWVELTPNLTNSMPSGVLNNIHTFGYFFVFMKT